MPGPRGLIQVQGSGCISHLVFSEDLDLRGDLRGDTSVSHMYTIATPF